MVSAEFDDIDEGDDDSDLMVAINTTPLVDVMLVLLIIFLITVPVALQSVPLTLPRERASAIESAANPDLVVLSVDGSGRFFWNNMPLAGIDEVKQRLSALTGPQSRPVIRIRADGRVRYGVVGEVIALSRSLGFTKLSFVTDPSVSG